MQNQRERKKIIQSVFQRRESSPSRPEGQNPLSTLFLRKGPTVFRKKWHFLAFSLVHKCTFMDVNLQERLALRRRLHAKETIDILNDFFKSRSEKVRQILVLVGHYFSSKQCNGNCLQPKSRNRSSPGQKSNQICEASHFSFIFPASFASTLNVPMVHCTILLDGSCSRVSRFPHLIRLGTRQLQFTYQSANEGCRNEPRIKFVVKWRGKVVLSRCHGSKLSR